MKRFREWLALLCLGARALIGQLQEETGISSNHTLEYRPVGTLIPFRLPTRLELAATTGQWTKSRGKKVLMRRPAKLADFLRARPFPSVPFGAHFPFPRHQHYLNALIAERDWARTRDIMQLDNQHPSRHTTNSPHRRRDAGSVWMGAGQDGASLSGNHEPYHFLMQELLSTIMDATPCSTMP